MSEYHKSGYQVKNFLSNCCTQKHTLWVFIRSTSPHRGTSNEYPQHIFSCRNKKFMLSVGKKCHCLELIVNVWGNFSILREDELMS